MLQCLILLVYKSIKTIKSINTKRQKIKIKDAISISRTNRTLSFSHKFWQLVDKQRPKSIGKRYKMHSQGMGNGNQFL